jgi:hypothetical protein
MVGHRSAPPLEVDYVLELLRAEDEDNTLAAIVVQRVVEIRIIQRRRLLRQCVLIINIR